MEVDRGFGMGVKEEKNGMLFGGGGGGRKVIEGVGEVNVVNIGVNVFGKGIGGGVVSKGVEVERINVGFSFGRGDEVFGCGEVMGVGRRKEGVEFWV